MSESIFKYYVMNERELRKKIKDCKEYGHFQQVAYSVQADALTQVCFECKIIRTTLK